MREYKKLVRDKIPNIIENKGDAAITRILSDEEYSECLKRKLLEETQEFLTDGIVEELADIYEVILAILKQKNITLETFEKIRNQKLRERGGFDNKIFLDSVIDKSENGSD